MQVIYSTNYQIIEGFSIFLCGPSPRTGQVLNWRKDALEILEKIGFNGTVIVPEPKDGIWPSNYDNVVEWEEHYLEMANRIVFWVCRDYAKDIRGMTTNIEFGLYYKTGKIIYGRPNTADDIRNLDWRYKNFYNKKPHTDLESLLIETIKL